tara:strand:- start:18463 stop:19596 length:1134 start_codon:yes stop_codon:yes gene_type:complete
MTKQDIKDFLKENVGYLKKGSEFLSEKFNCSVETCKLALREARAELKGSDFDLDNVSDNEISEFNKFLKENEIDKSDIKSVKFWQNMTGDHRFSVVVKGEDDLMKAAKQELIELLEANSPLVEGEYKPEFDAPVAYEISLPDIHYGKQVGDTLEDLEDEYMSRVKSLMHKANGLDVERIILPVGNDGMNSEGYSRATTKGTPQLDCAEWQQTFVGYCALMVRAIEYLSKSAPVDVVIIQGNHDFERMFYAGEFLRAYFINNTAVSIDNGFDSRKYYSYGVNMIMYTHGDKEKPAEMPLIMATERPMMFAESKFREVHCGHLHKEMVNEYRGVKVRFIPSICKNDSWHKTMGYEAKRVAQAHIWNKSKGYEGYLQTNI